MVKFFLEFASDPVCKRELPFAPQRRNIKQKRPKHQQESTSRAMLLQRAQINTGLVAGSWFELFINQLRQSITSLRLNFTDSTLLKDRSYQHISPSYDPFSHQSGKD